MISRQSIEEWFRDKVGKSDFKTKDEREIYRQSMKERFLDKVWKRDF